jgi:hypothetical protein
MSFIKLCHGWGYHELLQNFFSLYLIGSIIYQVAHYVP